MFRRMTVVLTLAICATTALALPRPSEVKAAVTAGNYAKAESMLLEVVKEKPSAKAHYDLGQVYTFEGKHKDALNEYRQAQALDPSLKFASSAAEFTKKLTTEQTLVAPLPPVVQYTVPAISATAPIVQHDSSGAGGTILAVFLVLLIAAGATIFFLLCKKTNDDLGAKIVAAKERTNALLDLAKKLEDSTLIAKTATYNDATKRQILDRIAVLQTQVRNALADLKDGKEVSASRVATIETNVNDIVERSANGLPTPTPSVVSQSTSAWASAPKPMFREYPEMPSIAPIPAPTPSVIHHYHHEPAPAPVVVNNSGTDMLTGILIGEALNRPARRDDDSYELPRYAPPPATRYSPPEPAPTFDSSNDSNNDYTDSSSSMDSGSSSNDNDSY